MPVIALAVANEFCAQRECEPSWHFATQRFNSKIAHYLSAESWQKDNMHHSSAYIVQLKIKKHIKPK